MEQFFRDLAELKGYNWRVLPTGMIRASHGETVCPLWAVAVSRGHNQLNTLFAARFFGIYNYQADGIVAAADNMQHFPEYCPRLRRRILDTLGLQGE